MGYVMYSYLFDQLARFHDPVSGTDRVMLDSELQHEINETYDWGDDYEGGFVYSGDDSMYEGLTILDHPHIDGSGSVCAIPLYVHE